MDPDRLHRPHPGPLPRGSGWIVWGSELSPFALKLRALLDYGPTPYRWLPADGRRRENLAAQLRIAAATRRRAALRYPRTTALDEYPLVPFLVDASGRVLCDSSALARWLDDCHPAPAGPLVPFDPALRVVARLIDEAFDELGLYLVHHARWVVSAGANDAGARLGRELRRVLPPGAGPLYGRWFAARQVRRLPYLFSVAPPGFAVAGLPARLTPPARAGFPPTHALLDELWDAYLDAVEAILTRQPFLLGDAFTLADASVYGQLGMNLADRAAAVHLRERVPTTYRWLCRIRDRAHVGRGGALALGEHQRTLLDLIGRTFVPLMRQNATAYEVAVAAGETLFNEPAFDRGRALYDGTLLGTPFRAVVKTFQVQVWRELRAAWAALEPPARGAVAALLPADAVETLGGGDAWA